MQEQGSREQGDRSGPGGVSADPQASELPARYAVYAAKVSSLCSGDEWTEGPGYQVAAVRLYSRQ